ncbi:hypothetical protein [Trueperella pyogenes]|nr:hypothetical protein [Trueperella pyogenes]MCI7688942.1 hypothetical protein [Trueperella pyogenes]
MLIATDEITTALTDETRDSAPVDPDLAAKTARQAATLVGDYIGSVAVPQSIALLAAVEVARELLTRQQAPGGVFSPFGEASPVRLARSPMKSAWAILAPYMPGGFA